MKLFLLAQMQKSFRIEEIVELIYLLDIYKDEIAPPGTAKKPAIINLLIHCGDHQMTTELLEICADKRPQLDWSF